MRGVVCTPLFDGSRPGSLSSHRAARARVFYDVDVRQYLVVFLLMLMPLRLWAGVGMSLQGSESFVHLSVAAATEGRLAPAMAPMEPDCHEAHADKQASIAAEANSPECHDGVCQLCAVCHQAAGMATWEPNLPLGLAHALPVGELLVPGVPLLYTLTKPPIS